MKNNHGWLGEGPQRKRRCKRARWENRTTELHEALSSFGRRDRTRHLSDGEFYSQLGQEVGYLSGVGAKHFGRAAHDLANMADKVLGLLFA